MHRLPGANPPRTISPLSVMTEMAWINLIIRDRSVRESISLNLQLITPCPNGRTGHASGRQARDIE